jgi:hypothetical protein
MKRAATDSASSFGLAEDGTCVASVVGTFVSLDDSSAMISSSFSAAVVKLSAILLRCLG